MRQRKVNPLYQATQIKKKKNKKLTQAIKPQKITNPLSQEYTEIDYNPYSNDNNEDAIAIHNPPFLNNRGNNHNIQGGSQNMIATAVATSVVPNNNNSNININNNNNREEHSPLNTKNRSKSNASPKKVINTIKLFKSKRFLIYLHQKEHHH